MFQFINWLRAFPGGVLGVANQPGFENLGGRKAHASSNLAPSAFGRRNFSEGNLKRRPSADKVRRQSMYYVYLLMCKDQKSYVGCSSDLKERLDCHTKGYVPATKGRLPVKLIAYFAFKNKYTAFNFEKYLKSGSGRAFAIKHLLS